MSALTNVVSVLNYIFIQDNPNIVNLSGFEGLTSLGGGTTSSIRIIGNNSLVSLEGLNNIERAPKSVVILSNPVLTDISALETLNLVGGDFTLGANPQLNNCCVLDDIRIGQLSILGAVTINNNDVNCSSLYDIVLSCSTSRLDTDSDTILDSEDNCVNTANTAQTDSDGDGVGDVCDNCPNVANPTQIDTNNNGIGDVCENDAGLNTGSDNGGVGIGTTNPHSILEIADGDIFLNNPYRGVILKSQDGKCYRYRVNSSGQLIGKEITCPDN
ncbi:MAG: hypothetical protein GYB32_06460 [Algicola sp.]|nr:hypothetical protein [Algicola sp.]